MLDLWNNPISNGGNPPGQLDAAVLRSIATLREDHDIERYEAGLKAILAPRR